MERHTTLVEMKAIYPYILKTLEEIKTSRNYDNKTITEASGLHTYLSSTAFIMAFVITEHMMGYTKTLSQQLQGELNIFKYFLDS